MVVLGGWAFLMGEVTLYSLASDPCNGLFCGQVCRVATTTKMRVYCP